MVLEICWLISNICGFSKYLLVISNLIICSQKRKYVYDFNTQIHWDLFYASMQSILVKVSCAFKIMYTLLVLNVVFYKNQLDRLRYDIVPILYLVTDFVFGSINCWERKPAISVCNCEFVYLSFLLLHVFWSSLISCTNIENMCLLYKLTFL